MIDKREDILARLLAIGEGLDYIVTAGRNIKRPPDDRLPAYVVLDADEAAEEGDPPGRPTTAPRRVGMTPELYLLHGGKPETVGPLLNALRVQVLHAILTDAELRTIVGSNGAVRYEGCATGLSWGREGMIGDMGVSFTFLYFLNPADLI